VNKIEKGEKEGEQVDKIGKGQASKSGFGSIYIKPGMARKER
jgi:hypothetical protein